MNNMAFVASVPDVMKAGNMLDLFMKRTLTVLRNRGGDPDRDTLHHLVFCDFTKMGRLSQTDINSMCNYMKFALELNPLKSCGVVMAPLLSSNSVLGGLRGEMRRIEDKLMENNLEMRLINIRLGQSRLHGNASIPANFPGWMVIHETSVPKKGTDYRARAEKDKDMETRAEKGQENKCLACTSLRDSASQCFWGGGLFLEPFCADEHMSVLRFCSSVMWQCCGPLDLPEMIPADDYERPQTWQNLKSYEGRATYTHVEETAQWLGGGDIPKAIIASLFNGVTLTRNEACGVIVHNPTAYEGALERSIIMNQDSYPVPVASFSLCASPSSGQVELYIKKQVTTLLVDWWKSDKGPLTNLSPDSKYVAWKPEEHTVASPSAPTTKVLKVVDKVLTIPQDIRSKYLQDPMRGPEWKRFMSAFDTRYSMPLPTATPAAAAEAAPTLVVEAASTPASAQELWDTIFPDEPRDLQSFESKYKRDMHLASFDYNGVPAYFVIVAEGVVNKLFIIGKETDATVDTNQWCLGHGPGSWLQDDKAEKFIGDSPDKSFPINWGSDQAACRPSWIGQHESCLGPLLVALELLSARSAAHGVLQRLAFVCFAGCRGRGEE